MTEPETLGRRQRKPSLKRRLQEASDDEDEVYKRPPPKKAPKSSRSTKRAKSSSEEAPTAPTPAGVGSPTAASENMDVDIEGDAPATSTTPSVVSASILAASGSGATRPPPPQRSRSQQDVAPSSQPKRRRRAVVLSDDSDDDFDASKADAAEPQDDEEDMSRKQSGPSRASSPPAKTTDKSTPGPSRSANAILSARIPKKKRTADKDDKPVLMKNESKTTTSSPASASPAGSVLSIADATKSTPVQPVRKKLPPIKKFKPGEGPAATSSPLSARPGGGSDKLSDLLPPSSKARTQARTGDVDLSNGMVWDSLFNSGKAGGGSARQKEEERRQTVQKLRDEARARREANLATCFDLQAVMDKVSKFEQRFAHRNALFFPSFLAGALGDRPLAPQSQPEPSS